MEHLKYAGLRIEDKAALLDAKAKGAEWVARDRDGLPYGYASKPTKYPRMGEWYTDDGFCIGEFDILMFVNWSDHEPVNIDLALAQIAEMKTAQKPTAPPRTNQARFTSDAFNAGNSK